MKRLLLLAALAANPAAAQTVNIAVGGAITTVDPHFHNAAPNNALSAHIFNNFIERDANTQPIPGLAMSWRTLGDTVWEFKLRPGVTWHDGVPFTADDVVFTLSRIPDVPRAHSGFTGFIRNIRQVEVVDPLTIRFVTEAPHPLMLNDLGSVAVISRHVGSSATTEDYNRARGAIGTGPYRLAAFRPNEVAELVRNNAYWNGPEPWERVNYRPVPNATARTAALLSGSADLIDQVGTSDLPQLRGDSRFTVSEVVGGRVIYLGMNLMRPDEAPYVTDNAGRPLPTNPFQDLRVRQALSISINREALTRQLMQGIAAATGQWLPPGAFGYNTDIPVPNFDPERARRLLAEAGYPEGFRIALQTPNDRYPNDSRVAQAVAQMWSRIGVRTTVEAQPWSVHSTRGGRQDFAIRLIGWGAGTGEASYALVNILATYNRERGLGAANFSRYSNPRLDSLSDRAAATVDEGQRRQLFEDAVKLAMDDVAFIPMYQLNNIWAMRKGLTFEARADEHTRIMGLRATQGP